MLRNQLRRAPSGRLILGTPDVGILTATIAANTATGDNGPGLLYDDSLLSGNSGKQLRCRITGYTGTLSALFVNEDGSFTLTGEADGSYTISYAVDADAVQVFTDTATVNVGAVNASAGAGTGTSTGTGTGGEATAGNSAAAPGGVVTSIGIGSGGRARGNNGLAPTVFVKISGSYEQVSAMYVKQTGLYQQASVYVKQPNSWIQL